MFNIKDFLKCASGRQTKELFFRKAVQDAIKNIIEIEIPITSIILKINTIYLKDVSQTARSAIFIKKSRILEEVNKKQDFYTVNELR